MRQRHYSHKPESEDLLHLSGRVIQMKLTAAQTKFFQYSAIWKHRKGYSHQFCTLNTYMLIKSHNTCCCTINVLVISPCNYDSMCRRLLINHCNQAKLCTLSSQAGARLQKQLWGKSMARFEGTAKLYLHHLAHRYLLEAMHQSLQVAPETIWHPFKMNSYDCGLMSEKHELTAVHIVRLYIKHGN